MHYRDQPTVQVETTIAGDPEAIWALVTDIELPARLSAELQSVQWLDGATGVAIGNRFRGHNRNDGIGEWSTICTVIEFDPGRRWVWQVMSEDNIMATWGFEVDPGRTGVTVRQWARMGPDPSGLSMVISTVPDKEGRIISRRMEEWRSSMSANLETMKVAIEGGGSTE